MIWGGFSAWHTLPGLRKRGYFFLSEEREGTPQMLRSHIAPTTSPGSSTAQSQPSPFLACQIRHGSLFQGRRRRKRINPSSPTGCSAAISHYRPQVIHSCLWVPKRMGGKRDGCSPSQSGEGPLETTRVSPPLGPPGSQATQQKAAHQNCRLPAWMAGKESAEPRQGIPPSHSSVLGMPTQK